MRICMFQEVSSPFTYNTACDGAAKSTLEIAKRLAKSNEVFIVNTNIGNYLDSRNDVLFIGTAALQRNNLDTIIDYSVVRPLAKKYPWIAADSWLRKMLIHVILGLIKMPKNVDILHATTPLALMLKDYFGVRSKVNFLHLHGSPSSYAFLSTKLRSLFLKNITAVIVPSNYVKCKFLELFGQNCRVYVVYDGVDQENFDQVRSFTKTDDTVLFVGAIVPFKGLHNLIGAVKFLQMRGLNIRLKIVGSPYLWTPEESYLGYYRSLLALGRKFNVTFEGEKYGEELLRAYKEAAVLAVPSIGEEALGIVALEGMAAGLPVVASKTGGLVEIVKHEETGLLVPPNDVEALAGAIERLIENEELRSKLAENAQNMVKSQFTWDSSFKQICNVYSKYLA